MKSTRLHSSFLLAAGLGFAFFATGLRAQESGNTIKFSDPAKPGTVKIVAMRGDIRIQGADTGEVTVKTEAKAVTRAPRKDGMRVLTASSSFALTEKDNVVTLDAASEGWHGGASDFNLTVPRNTSLVIQSSWGGGDIRCTDISGDIQINCLNGEVRLDNVSGGVVVETHNGEINASIHELREGKPLSFTSLNGEIVLRVPTETKATVRLRTQNGSVLTDFAENALVTKTESAPRSASKGRRTITYSNGSLPPEAREAIRESIRVATEVSREVAESVREGVASARARAEVDRERSERTRERAVEAHGSGAHPVPPVPPMPPMPSIPTISGGKLVTGTLNGGGPEISVSTMNGDVTLRQLERK